VDSAFPELSVFETYSFVKGTPTMPFNRRDKNQDVLMAEIMSEEDQDLGMVKPEDFVIEGQDPARLRRILKYTDNAGKSPLSQPTPDRNKARAKPRKAKS
jgi:hypothetical protein